MATVREVLDFIVSLAKMGQGVDADGVYGTQCVDLPNYISYHYFGKWLCGNAIDLLDSAEAQGFDVLYVSDGAIAKKGDIFVKHYVAGDSVDYGHTGLVIEDSDGDTLKTIEQNIDGNWDYLEVGGPARFNERSYDGIVGFIRFPYESDTSTSVQQEGWIQDSVGWYFKNQDGTYPFNAWKKIDGNWFRFNNDGYALENTWFKDDEGFWYWLKPGGYMAIGWHKIGGKWYFFNDVGEMKTGWIRYFDKWYYCNESNGDMISKEVRKIGDAYYYFNGDGEMLEKASIRVDESGAIHFEE